MARSARFLPVRYCAFLFLIVPVLLGGCASINIPHYVGDEHPYEKTFYNDYEAVLKVTKDVLDETGWKIFNITNPSVYEQSKVVVPQGKQILILTEVRLTPMFLGTRYSRLNIYLRAGTEVNTTYAEIRYVSVNSFFYMTFKNYNKNTGVKNLFNRIEKKLE